MRRLAIAAVLLLAGCGENAREPPPPAEPGTQVLLAGDGEMWLVDVEAERARHVRDDRLSPGDAPHRVLQTGGEFVLWGYATYVLEGRGLRRIVDDSHVLFPSDRPGRVWVGVLDAKQRMALREVDVAGRTTVPGRHPPARLWPQAASGHGLVFQDGRDTLLWDPVADRHWRLDADGATAASGDLLVACGDDPCPELELLDLDTGARRAVAAPAGLHWSVHGAAFAPAGDRLAVLVHDGDPRSPHRLALVDVSRGDARLVPGSDVPPGYTMVTWSAEGHELFVTGGDRFKERVLVAYRIGDPRARRLAVAVGDFYDMAAR